MLVGAQYTEITFNRSLQSYGIILGHVVSINVYEFLLKTKIIVFRLEDD